MHPTTKGSTLSSHTEAPAEDSVVEEVPEAHYAIVHGQTLSYFQDRASDLKATGKPVSVVLTVSSSDNPAARQIRLDASKIKVRQAKNFVTFKATYLGSSFKGVADFDTTPFAGSLRAIKQ